MEKTDSASRTILIFTSLGALYIFWGSSYLANQICLRTISPLVLMSLRFITAGGFLLMLGIFSRPARMKKFTLCFAFVTGILLVGSNTFVAVAQEYMPSSAVATMVGAVPLWALFFSSCVEKRINLKELRPVGLGFLGVLLLTFGWRTSYPLWPSFALIFATMVWAGTSVWIARARLPMTSLFLGVQMFAGGIAVLAVAWGRGDVITGFSSDKSVEAFSFLVLGPSLLAYSAYNYLLRTTKASIATSYAFACPLVATLLGISFLKESPESNQYIALALILSGLIELLAMDNSRSKRKNKAITPDSGDIAA